MLPGGGDHRGSTWSFLGTTTATDFDSTTVRSPVWGTEFRPYALPEICSPRLVLISHAAGTGMYSPRAECFCGGAVRARAGAGPRRRSGRAAGPAAPSAEDRRKSSVPFFSGAPPGASGRVDVSGARGTIGPRWSLPARSGAAGPTWEFRNSFGGPLRTGLSGTRFAPTVRLEPSYGSAPIGRPVDGASPAPPATSPRRPGSRTRHRYATPPTILDDPPRTTLGKGDSLHG